MATDVDCPSCDQKLRVPDDLLGKKVKCPACKMMFSATAHGLEEPAGAPPVDEGKPPSRASGLTASRRGTPPSKRSEDEADDESPPRSKDSRVRRKRFRDYQPHRGTIILVLGILAIVTGLHLILGPIAWIMGNNDLKEIHAGQMDPEGEGMTNIGRILGMVATILGIVALVVGCIFLIIWLIFVVGFLGLAAGASGH
jgi:hypothetical protein